MKGDGKPRDACGVFGIYAPHQPVAYLTFDGIFVLQHRGEESAGMAVSDGQNITVVKDMGLVSKVFGDQRTLAPLQGHIAIGHTRYSTTGSSSLRNAQPAYRAVGGSGFALGHNGNLTNTLELAAANGLPPADIGGSDSDLVAELLAAEDCDLEQALTRVLPRLQGAFSFVAMDATRLVGVRDPNGFRPMCLGRLDDGWVLASESAALDVIAASFVREIDPGEMVVIDAGGVRSMRPFPAERVRPCLCIVEFAYFARPDSVLYGKEVHGARRRMGEALADVAPVAADMVIGVPLSAIPAAEGYAERSRIPYGQGLVHNRYIGRTFIDPTQDGRVRKVRRKLNALRESVRGKRLVVVDDSIVRGTTQRVMVGMLREAGATEVHLRVTLPPWRWPCFYGIDVGSRAEILAADLELSQIRDLLGVDSLAYLSLDAMVSAIGAPGAGFCNACLTGDYPTEVPLTRDPVEIRRR